MLRRFLLGLLALALALGSHPAGAEHLPFRIYTTADGLVGDAVSDLLADSRGFLWIATTSGLSRFDGEAFRSYDAAQGLPSPRVYSLWETRAGVLWVTTGAGLARLDPARRSGGAPFEPVPVPAGAGNSRVSCLLEDRSGRLWVCQPDALVLLDGTSRPPRRFPLPAGTLSQDAVVEGADGSLWVGLSAGLLRRLPNGAERRYAVEPPNDAVGVLAVDDLGRLWIGRGNGLYIFWPEAESAPGDAVPLAERARRPAWPGELPARPGEVLFYDRSDGLPGATIFRVSIGPSGTVWVATLGGMAAFSNSGLRTLTPDQGLPEPAATVAIEDRDGTLWIGSESRGLARLGTAGFTSFGTDDGLARDRISSLLEDAEGVLHVVTGSSELHRFDGRRFERITPDLPRRAPGWGWNEYFVLDRRGSWWFPTSEGLIGYSPPARPADLATARPAERWGVAEGMPSGDLFRVFEDRRGDLWVSLIATPPLVRLVGGRRLEAVPQLSGPASGGAPTAFAEDAAGNLWMGFYEGGLARVRGAEWRFFGAAEGVPPGFVSDLHRDRRGRLWLATVSGGVARIDDADGASPRFERFTSRSGLTTDSARCLADDAQGRLYIGTSRGVDRLEPESGRVRHFGRADGLPNDLVITCHGARDGPIWFGTLHGLARLDPTAEPAARAPVVRVAGLRVGGEARPLSDLGVAAVADLVLAPREDDLAIDFLVLGASGARLQHRLEGGADSWSVPTTARTVVFPRLAPGRYRLLARAVSAEGAVSPEPATVSFVLRPPVWRRTWFLALVASALVAAGSALYRLRLRRLLAVERVRTRIAADLHDEVGASLSRIGFLGEMARARVVSDPGEAVRMLAQISADAGEVTEATADLVWAVDPREDDLGSLLVRLRRFATDLLGTRGIRLEVVAPADAASVTLTPEIRRGLHLALKEAFHNVAKHSQARTARLTLTLGEGEIRAVVEDDGVGIAEAATVAAQAAGRRGLPGLRRRLRELGGNLEIVTAPGEGTRIELRLPLHPRRRPRMNG
jgi:ligand-binding sensor domain-containing protein